MRKRRSFYAAFDTIPTMPRFLLIGLDGLEPTLATRWMDEGRLPNLARLRDSGCFMPCASTRPPVTFPAWTTCVTGVNPGKHGIFDFTELDHARRGLRFINSTARKAPALWNVLSDAGKRVCVLGVPGTYPPEPVNGIMVSGFDSPVASAVDTSFVYPRSEFENVRRWRFADFQESHIGPGWHDAAFAALVKKLEDKVHIADTLLRRESWDFFMVVFGESDTVAHHFWLFHDRASPRHQHGLTNAIRDVYERLDSTVGRLIDAAGEDVIFGIVSDHGFGGAGTGVVHLNNWLAENGYLRFTRDSNSLLKKLALRFVPQSLRGTLFRRFSSIASAAEAKSRFAGIDWSRTRAWSEELNYFPSIRINLRGRDPEGAIDPAAYGSLVSELCRKLEQWPPIARALPRAEVFHGPHIESAPDIILELAFENGYSYNCLRARGGPSFRRLLPHEYLGGKEKGMTGNHRDPGVLFLSVPLDADHASLQDVAPTVLALLEVPAPPMDGHSLLSAQPTPALELAYTAPAHTYGEAEASIVEERLRQLGYFE